MIPEGLIPGLGDFFGSVPQVVEEATASVRSNAETLGIIAKIPGYGLLFTVDTQGLRFTKTGQMILGALAMYGVIRMAGK